MSQDRRQAGFTLIELMIAITLVAAISAGLLTTMRNALLTMERTQARLEENRRALGIQDLIRRQIDGLIPVRALCGTGEQPVLADIFRGNRTSLLLVTNESMTEGARGYPHVALYQVQPNPDGTFRLEVSEQVFSGPTSTAPYCEADPRVLHSFAGVQPVVLLNKLAFCHFAYRNLNQNTLFGREWMEAWVLPYAPYSVRIEMEAAPNSDVRMPVGSITIPLRISRTPGERYFDE